jgi:uncharacterized protein (DUF433 family)
MEAPIRQEPSGAIRVGNTRVLLELVIHAFRDGATPEAIISRYDSLSLSDVYGVIAFYLRNRDVVDAYVAERDRIGDENERLARPQQEIDLADIRARMEARRKLEASHASPAD